uniref:Uncharacterized protein n=1 Tax=Candidatus Kentrum sp. LPFa TaxID=2126335 RepID=A0A450XZA0_9GAMM|nr:MAG: hypothetical protein BECKLPF1236A_GA0070988_102901 [Candidatus Kentron sp. LPFa]VFK34628.1 MAG: hypothetical protein BECKLPF1236C_GA0070990_102871 [Candidatus Kentron sp. LPFa]
MDGLVKCIQSVESVLSDLEAEERRRPGSSRRSLVFWDLDDTLVVDVQPVRVSSNTK